MTRWGIVNLVALVAACSAYDPALLNHRDGALDDGATRDSSLPDAADDDASNDDSSVGDGAVGDAGENGCVPSDMEFCPMICPETCNGMDDDCDSRVDEEGSEALCTLSNATATCVSGICLVVQCLDGAADCDTLPSTGCEVRLDTPQNCGFCYARCNFPNAVARCDQATCAFDECIPGFGNCDGDDSNGCEFTVNSLDNCGGCDVMCGAVDNGQPGCINFTCGVGDCDPGFEDCDGDVDNGCETSLDALGSCGNCDIACNYAHATPVCAAQVCVPGACLDGYSDCDSDPLNECEVSLNTDPNNCGTCGRVCDPGGVGGFACVAGECVVTSCATGLADCDSDANNGCETSSRTLTDCAGCGIACAFPNASASCTTGTCTFSLCEPGMGNCNTTLSDGCETPLDTDQNCGACAATCGVNDSRTCSGGVCSLVSCTSGSADCDNDGLTCEQSLNTVAHCGACNARCGDAMGRLTNASASCGAGSCAIGSCDATYANCDGSAVNGCETSLRTTADCGACGSGCSRPNAGVTCATGSCAITACNTGFADCDGNQVNGCETPTNTDLNCGACGTACTQANANTTCSSGSCTRIACNAGFGDCDGNAQNGCETPLNSLTHCGACNTACALSNGSENCSTGSCTLGTCSSGYGNCDFIAFNGCETQLNSTTNCNACGALCDYTNGTEVCSGGTCTLTGCSGGYGNCDTNEQNGCEQALNNNTHCGGCNVACTRDNAAASCGSGTCTLGLCNPGFGNCDGNAQNGCETPLNTDLNCGACAAVCGVSDSRTCSGGVCSLSSCATGTADCDNDGTTCEQSLYTLTNCGGCGVACGLANATATCPAGSCTLSGCNTGFGNCDSDGGSGCEQPLNTSAHCGGCNVACARDNASASCSTGTCTLGTCNPGFGNCDGNAANGCETALNSLTHCGACNTACARTNAAESCSTGTCALGACDPNFGDCDGNASNGCETPLTTTTNCAACSTVCDYAGATESCATGSCAFGSCQSGFGNCDTNQANGCEAALSTLTDCGGCNVACSRANAAESCATGSCVLGACDSGFGNCDTTASNGCEVALTSLTHCGGCNIACARTNAAESCATGTCTLGNCDAGYGNCDSNATNGCEAPLSTLTDCGGCNVACTRTNAAATCPSGTCTLGACNSGFGNCDSNATNGCETPLTSLTHCGGCNVACARTNATATCATGTCALASCNSGYGNCDSNANNGCETQLNTDSNCGVCGTVCNTAGGMSCVGGTCTLTSCTAGTADCDNDGLTCEQSLSTLTHCGACNVACSRPNATASCSTGTCALGACNANFGNCDGNAGNGCEQATTTNAHCGGCGISCSRSNAAASCGGGVCTLGACNAGYGNCDGNAANGCETQLNSTTHCGGCNVACDLANAGESCATGTCALGTCNGGFGDCDLVASTGCETQLNSTANCNACNATCDYAAATESCSTGTCTFGACNSGSGNCDGNTSNGCEQALTNNTHCAACGVACTRANAAASCSTGTCTLGTCNSGFANCDSNGTNGCETTLGTAANCGACGDACAVDETCTNSVCQGSFTYTPSNFDPVGITHTAAATLNCGISIFNSTTLAFTNWCGPQPSVATRTQSGGPDVVVLGFGSLTIASGATLQLTGNRPVILAVYGDATINGTIDASASTTTPGAGGNWSCGTSAGGNGAGSCNVSAGGGGGGGHATNGAIGGTSAAPGVAGVARGSANDSPLLGGCNGGNGGGCATTIGGGGGGAIQLSAAGVLTLGATGRVLATGGNGLIGGCSCNDSGGGGGGSGGAVLLEGNTVTTVSGATITANGGKGGNGQGSDGGIGGNGGTGTTSPVTPANSGSGGGGGGGAVGRGYIRGVTSCSLAQTSSIALVAGGVCPMPLAPPPGSTCRLFANAGHNYYFCDETTRHWNNARIQCQSIGFDLVRVNDGAENAFLLSRLTVAQPYALGGSDSVTADRWVWVIGNAHFWQGVQNGAAQNGLYTNWETGQPNGANPDEDFAYITNGTGTWNDDDSNPNRPFICESL